MKTHTLVSSTLIKDGQSLVSAKGRFDHAIPVYDDGFGPMFIHRNSMGISGIVRAQTWEDAYEICEDEFFPEANETVEELRKEYNVTRKHVKIIRTREGVERPAIDSDYPRTIAPLPDCRPSWEFVRWETITKPCENDENGFLENDLFCEAFGFRPSGARAGKWDNGEPRDPLGHGIYAKDLNGDSLDLLTPALIAQLEITLEIKGEADESDE